MFGETEVNPFYLLIATVFLVVSFPYTLKGTAVNETNFIENTKNVTVFCGGFGPGPCFWLACVWNAHLRLHFRLTADILTQMYTGKNVSALWGLSVPVCQTTFHAARKKPRSEQQTAQNSAGI